MDIGNMVGADAPTSSNGNSSGGKVISDGAFLAASIIPTISGIVSNIVGNNKQNEYNEKQIDAMNDYNSPSNQMRLLAEAGLNPNLVMSNGGLGSAIQQEANKQEENVGSNIGELISANINSQTLVNEAQAENLKAGADKLRNEVGFRAREVDAMVNQANQFIAESKKRIDQMGREIQHLDFVDAYISTQQYGQETENKIKFEKWMQEQWNTKFSPAEHRAGLDSVRALAHKYGVDAQVGERTIFEMRNSFGLKLAMMQKDLDVATQQSRLLQFQADNEFYKSELGRRFNDVLNSDLGTQYFEALVKRPSMENSLLDVQWTDQWLRNNKTAFENTPAHSAFDMGLDFLQVVTGLLSGGASIINAKAHLQNADTYIRRADISAYDANTRRYGQMGNKPSFYIPYQVIR